MGQVVGLLVQMEELVILTHDGCGRLGHGRCWDSERRVCDTSNKDRYINDDRYASLGKMSRQSYHNVQSHLVIKNSNPAAETELNRTNTASNASRPIILKPTPLLRTQTPLPIKPELKCSQ